jgi:hypothetical protein
VLYFCTLKGLLTGSYQPIQVRQGFGAQADLNEALGVAGAVSALLFGRCHILTPALHE